MRPRQILVKKNHKIQRAILRPLVVRLLPVQSTVWSIFDSDAAQHLIVAKKDEIEKCDSGVGVFRGLLRFQLRPVATSDASLKQHKGTGNLF